MGATATKPTTPEGWSKRANGSDKIRIPATEWESIPVLPCEMPTPVYEDTADCNIFTVQSCFPVLAYVLSIPCTMTIYRDANGDVTLFNVFRVPAEVEDAILHIGPVKHVVKLGAFHGAADAYYLNAPKFGAPKYWALDGMRYADGLEKPNTLGTELPIKGAVLHTLESPFPEAVLTVPGVNGDVMLVAADTLVHTTDTTGVPLLGQLIFRFVGLAVEGVPRVAPVWFKIELDAVGREGLAPFYEKLWQLNWNSVVTAHGRAVLDVDKDKVKVEVNKSLAV